MARVEVKNQAGECVGSFGEEGFREWQYCVQQQLGARIGIAIGEGWLIDRQAATRHLPPGRHDATLVQKTPIPRHVRQKLQGYDVWKAM